MVRAAPDLSPWLSLLWTARREADAPEWAAAIGAVSPARRSLEEGACLLVGAPIGVPTAGVARAVHRLLAASGSGLRTKLGPDSALSLLAAAIEQDDAALAALSLELDVASPRLAAIAPFLAMPLLLACHRAWASDFPPEWVHGHCPVCAAWPALVELRGTDDGRRLRCSRCGAGWSPAAPRCPFCAGTGLDRRALKIARAGARAGHVVACQECGGYVKAVPTAAPIPAGDVAMRDLLTLDLDLAALAAGLERPAARVPRLDLRVAARPRSGLLAPLPGA